MRHYMQAPRRLNRSLLSCALAGCMAMTAPTVFAQSANATLRGQVAGPAGTTITAKNVATGAVRRTQAAANGSYTLVGLEPGTYTVALGVFLILFAVMLSMMVVRVPIGIGDSGVPPISWMIERKVSCMCFAWLYS